MIAALVSVALAQVAPSAVPEWVEVPGEDFAVVHRRPNPGRPAVVLCHGISSNHRFWDLAEDRSLAVVLWQAGYDVWNLDLRGHGAAVRGPDGHRQQPGWTIDDYGTGDLPALFDHIEAQTGAPPQHYVGHSMGGMVLAVYLAHHADPPLHSAVVVGSPLDFRDPDALVRALFEAAPAAGGLGFLPTPAGARWLATVRRSAWGRLDEVLHNPDNLQPRAEALMLRTVVSPLYQGEIEQFAHVRHDGEFRSADGALVYREALGGVEVPMLFVAGRADRIVAPDRVYSYYEAVGTDDKRFEVASVANGMHGDYGHLDLGVGDHARDDVFPLVVDWLREHP
jgi:pimeloyl-ACP methyl ester carboxylesterase